MADPTVIVSHLDITYRVVGADKHSADVDDDAALVSKLFARSRDIGRVHEVPAVCDISFVARDGESIGIIGRNGSGKSTLLRAVAGLIPPTNGRVWVSGRPSLLGVNAVLMPKLTGARNIELGCMALGMTREQVREKFDDIVEFSGIGDAVWLPMSTYSSGMAARLRFAISTAVAPDVLMVDEALATGDAEFRARSTERIQEIREQAGTVFLVSHSNSNIREICTRVLWIDRGTLIADGPTEDVLEAYEGSLPRKRSKTTTARDGRPEPEVPGVPRWTAPTAAETSVLLSEHTAEPGVEAVV
uniref:ABC transporter ATP-binding protein n=1 Tax=Kribbia dieselivorans TaxID=331526 RepID=UPI0009F8FDA6